MKIILASGSPRRKELLRLIVPNFEVIVSDVDETLKQGLSLNEQVTRLSYLKAKDVFDKTEGDRIIIGSDTMVTKNGKIYGKPKNKDDAKFMLNELLDIDKKHEVITGLVVILKKGEIYKEYKTFDKVEVFFRDISNDEMDRWIDSGKALDKAGAYGIQDEFGVFVDKIIGNYSSVVGLPIHKLYEIFMNIKKVMED